MTSLISIINNISNTSCPRDINLHCHTTCSDGSMTPEELINQATLKGVKHISITDHHTIKAYHIINELISNKQELGLSIPKLWSGIEITCLLKKCLVHVLGYGFKIDSEHLKIYTAGQSVIGEDLQARNVIKSIHKAGGIAILAHPARYRINYEILIEEAYKLGFDGAEAWYDYNYSNKWKPTPLICEAINKKLLALGMLSTCGTDTHGNDLYCR